MLPRIQELETVTYLEEFFKWGVHHGVGNKRQGIEREELRGLAQGRPFGLQVGFEIRNPFIQVLFVLQGREDVWDLLLDASSPVHPSSLQGSLGSSRVTGILLAWPSPWTVSSHLNITPYFTPSWNCQEYQRTRCIIYIVQALPFHFIITIFWYP